MRRGRVAGRFAGGAATPWLAGTALAHGAAIGGRGGGDLAVPTWLFLATGGAVIGASFLLASLATDRAFVRAVHEWGRSLWIPRRQAARVGRALGLVALAFVVYGGLAGPPTPGANPAILTVWVGWWAGLVMVTYLVGNAWPALDPARTLARHLPDGFVTYPSRLGTWPAVAALLALVYVEIVSPLATDPTLLVAAVLAYVVLSVAGAVAVGAREWFARVDPVARVFDTYGRVAPVQRDGDGLSVALPGGALVGLDFDRGEVAFVVALLWGTTFDGFVATPLWADLARPVVEAGVPPRLLYFGALLSGFGLFYGAFRLAAAVARRTGPTYVTTDALAGRFAASLLPIAAGYHFAHYLAYFLGLSPTLVSVLTAPTDPAAVVLVLPSWLGGVELAAVLAGHVVAVGVAHATAFEALPGRLQAIRTQYPLTAAMVLYTAVSLWIVSRPSATPPYL